MNINEYNPDLIRHTNWRDIRKNSEYIKLINKMKEIETFLSSFGFLSFGRDYIMCCNQVFALQFVSTSLELTAGSIISCCEYGCLSDANALLRKYRDDMFFYLYLLVYHSNRLLGVDKNNTKQMEENIKKWLDNNLRDLSIGKVMKAIGEAPGINKAVKKYKLQQYFDKIGDRLNNYVHSNGVYYYNRNINSYKENEFIKRLQLLVDDMRFITVTFLFLLTICSPLTIMSTDYTDCLDMRETPPDGSQYWVAPFVTDFFKSNLDLIDKSCIDYLKENTFMDFE